MVERYQLAQFYFGLGGTTHTSLLGGVQWAFFSSACRSSERSPFKRTSSSVKEISQAPAEGCQFSAESWKRPCSPESRLLCAAVRLSLGAFLSGPDWA